MWTTVWIGGAISIVKDPAGVAYVVTWIDAKAETQRLCLDLLSTDHVKRGNNVAVFKYRNEVKRVNAGYDRAVKGLIRMLRTGLGRVRRSEPIQVRLHKEVHMGKRTGNGHKQAACNAMVRAMDWRERAMDLADSGNLRASASAMRVAAAHAGRAEMIIRAGGLDRMPLASPPEVIVIDVEVVS